MPRHTTTEIVPYTPEQMYDLVVDMHNYPKFLPWCVHGTRFDEKENQFTAEMTISFKAFRETFRTIDKVIPGREVRITLLSGPFRTMDSGWIFTPVEQGARIDFFIDFQLKNKLLDLTLGSAFSFAAQKMVAAFHKRADDLYGRKAGGNSQ